MTPVDSDSFDAVAIYSTRGFLSSQPPRVFGLPHGDYVVDAVVAFPDRHLSWMRQQVAVNKEAVTVDLRLPNRTGRHAHEKLLRFYEEFLALGRFGEDMVGVLASTDNARVRRLLAHLLEGSPATTPLELLAASELRRKIGEVLLDQAAAPELVPILRKWARAMASGTARIELDKLALVGRGLADFEVRAALPDLEALLALRMREAREIAALAVARLGPGSSVNAIVDVMRDTGYSPRSRCAIAAALVRADIEAARTFLLEQYVAYLDRLEAHRSSGPLACPQELGSLHDAELMAALGRLAAEAPAGVRRNNIRSELQRMEISGAPMEDVRRMAASDRRQPCSNADAAIEAIGRRGGREEIAFLEGLAFGGRDVMKAVVKRAIRSIRMRTWREDEESRCPYPMHGHRP